MVHLRAPLLSDNARQEAQQALDVFVPRLMEALRRVRCGEPLNGEALDQPEWVRWQQMRPWRRADRAPWDDKLSDLEHWLRLSL